SIASLLELPINKNPNVLVRARKNPRFRHGLGLRRLNYHSEYPLLPRLKRNPHLPADCAEQLLERIHGRGHLAGQYLAEPFAIDPHRLGGGVGRLIASRGDGGSEQGAEGLAAHSIGYPPCGWLGHRRAAPRGG